MALGAGVIALSSVSKREHERWREAAAREGDRYGVDPEYTRARGAGQEVSAARHPRTWIDWVVVTVALGVLVAFASMAQAPNLTLEWQWAAGLAIATLAVLVFCAVALWRTTRFS
jgi:hypothetical protein